MPFNSITETLTTEYIYGRNAWEFAQVHQDKDTPVTLMVAILRAIEPIPLFQSAEFAKIWKSAPEFVQKELEYLFDDIMARLHQREETELNRRNARRSQDEA